MKKIKTLPIPENRNYSLTFKLKNYFSRTIKTLTVSMVLLLLVLPENVLQACGGTPRPPCFRTVFLAKFAPGVVVIPPAGGPINVPIGVTPWVNWSNNPVLWPFPVGASLNLTLTCFPSGQVIGPINFPVAVPMVPGPQPPGGLLLNFVIPAGVFPPGTPPQVCLVTGNYSVTFSDMVTITAAGDTEVCLVDPSPLNDTVPRLNMAYLPENGELYKTCRRGDQADSYFLIENNDPNFEVTFELNSLGRQVAQLPQGYTPSDAYPAGVYAISKPVAGTDTYPASFTDQLSPGQLLPETDPEAIDNQLLTRTYTLEPFEAVIVGITMRSFGMCADGSCNERLVKIEGTFANGDPALACTSTLYVVDDVDAKSSLCEFSDFVKVSPIAEAIWSPGIFGLEGLPHPHQSTFFAGNLDPASGISGFQTIGDALPDILEFPSFDRDIVRIDQPTNSVSYEVTYSSPGCNAFGYTNIVNLLGIDAASMGSVSVPVITYIDPTSPLEVFMDFYSGFMVLSAFEAIVYEGLIEPFYLNPPPDFCIDFETCRVIQKEADLGDKSIFVVPQGIARLFDDLNPPLTCDTLNVFDNFANPALWNATINGSGLILPSSSGGGTLPVCYNNINLLPVAPQTTVSYVDVSCPGALNNPVKVPFAIRVKPSCVPYWILNEDLATGIHSFDAAENITSTAVITGNANVTYNSGGDIDLLAGFAVDQGAMFQTQHTGCAVARNGGKVAIVQNKEKQMLGVALQLKTDEVVTVSLQNTAGKPAGRSMDAVALESGEHLLELDISGLDPGIYFCKIYLGTDWVSKKIVVTE